MNKEDHNSVMTDGLLEILVVFFVKYEGIYMIHMLLLQDVQFHRKWGEMRGMCQCGHPFYFIEPNILMTIMIADANISKQRMLTLCRIQAKYQRRNDSFNSRHSQGDI